MKTPIDICYLEVPLCEPAAPIVQAINACEFVLNALLKGPSGEMDILAKRIAVEMLAAAYLGGNANAGTTD